MKLRADEVRRWSINASSDILMAAANTILAWTPCLKSPQKEQVENVKVVAHRGAHSRRVKENTIEAFSQCLEHGVDSIEFDIRWTKDLVPVVHHDSTAERVFGRPDICLSNTTWEELRSEIPEIPSLQEVVQRFGQKIHFMIEVKEDESFLGKDLLEKKEQLALLSQVIESLEPHRDYNIISLSSSIYNYIDEALQQTFLPIARFNEKELVELCVEKKWSGFTSHYLLLTESLRQLLLVNNKKVGVGFVDSFQNFKREVVKGSYWIFTNEALHIMDCKRQLLSRWD